MFKALLALLAVSSAWAQIAQTVQPAQLQTICKIDTVGPSIAGLCPTTYTRITNGDCCSSQQTFRITSCVDKTNSSGVNECPGLKNFCNNIIYRTLMTQQCPRTCGFCTPAINCVDMVDKSTGRSECAGNVGLCNNSIYREMMKTQCPRTCGYCK